METTKDELLDTFQAETKDFKQLNFPLEFEFKIGTLANDFIAKDAQGGMIAYVRQKMFKFKEDVILFSDQSKSKELYRIKADRWIDFNANYSFTNANGAYMGSVGRKGMKSLWKASYTIFNPEKVEEYTVSEENPWAKVGDAVLGEIPIVAMFTGYLCNPKYIVKDGKGEIIARLSKQASFFGRKFKLDSVGAIPTEDGERIMLSLMMIVLLERRRG